MDGISQDDNIRKNRPRHIRTQSLPAVEVTTEKHSTLDQFYTSFLKSESDKNFDYYNVSIIYYKSVSVKNHSSEDLILHLYAHKYIF